MEAKGSPFIHHEHNKRGKFRILKPISVSTGVHKTATNCKCVEDSSRKS